MKIRKKNALIAATAAFAVAFAAGEYNPAKVLKFTLPYMILAILSCAVSATIFYPLG